jgi:hypothetical protein
VTDCIFDLSITKNKFMTHNIKIVEKNVYGKIMIYPACETSKKLADLLTVKTLNHYQLAKIEALGYVIENVTVKAFTS